jgi:non-ribosomal peptide synthase protein (TIGR01720 family)
VLLTPRRPLDRKLLTLALQELMNHHDALRLRFERLESGWQQRNAGPVAEVPLAWISLGDLPAAAQNRALQTRAAQLQASLDLAHGPIWRAAYFDLGPDQPGRLLLVIHHLAVDGVSWRILLDDLNAVYEQVSHGLAASLPAKTTAFQYWAQRLADHAGSAEVRRQAAYWCAVPSGPFHPLPVDWPADANLEGAAETVTTELGTAETTALLQEVPEAYGTEINDVLLTALVAAMAGWTGQRKLLISLEGHGRADIFEDVDLTRTVGWFTTAFPVELDLTHARGPGSALKTVKEQLRLIPGQGLGYGLLRYLGSDAPIVERLRALPQPEIAFNYLGQVDQFLEGMGNFEAAEEIGPVRSPKGRRGHLLELSAVVIRGCLRVQWTYAGNIYRRTTIEALAQSFIRELSALIAHCQGPEAGGYTPSDFSEALSEDEIEALLNEIK